VIPTRGMVRWVAWASVLLWVTILCPSQASASPEDSVPSVRRYTIRAEVMGLPETRGGDLTLRHEAVDDFTDIAGTVVGMNSMTMSFPVARGAMPHGLKVGDKVEAILVVDWGRGFQVLEHIRKLPRETALHFRKARKPANATE